MKIDDKAKKSAYQFLSNHGFEILDEDFSCHAGAINFVLGFEDSDGKYLVFTEVNQESCSVSDGPAFPDEVVTIGKREKLEKIAAIWLSLHPEMGECRVRFDILSLRIVSEHRCFCKLHMNVAHDDTGSSYKEGYKKALDDVSEKLEKLLRSPNQDVRYAAGDMYIALGELLERAGVKE